MTGGVDAAVLELKELIANGTIGDVKLIRANSGKHQL